MSLLMCVAVAMSLSGCLGRALQSIFAPQTVAADAISGSGQVAAAQAQPITAPALDAAATAQQLDAIISRNPNAANRDELTALRDHMRQRSGAAPVQRPRPISAAEDPRRRADWDRRVREKTPYEVLTNADGSISRVPLERLPPQGKGGQRYEGDRLRFAMRDHTESSAFPRYVQDRPLTQPVIPGAEYEPPEASIFDTAPIRVRSGRRQ